MLQYELMARRCGILIALTNGKVEIHNILHFKKVLRFQEHPLVLLSRALHYHTHDEVKIRG